MGFRRVGFVCYGLTVGGYSVAKYRDDKSGAVKVVLMRNGRSVARKTFSSLPDFAAWYTSTVPHDADAHDTIVTLTEVLKR